jgi:hypothetical protein
MTFQAKTSSLNNIRISQSTNNGLTIVTKSKRGSFEKNTHEYGDEAHA